MLFDALAGAGGVLGGELAQHAPQAAMDTALGPRFAPGLFDFLDMPRRGLWHLLNQAGIPMGETGADFAENLGLGRSGILPGAVGLGAEMLIDPVNLLTGGLGNILGRAARIPAQALLKQRRLLQTGIKTAGQMEGGLGQAIKRWAASRRLPVPPTGAPGNGAWGSLAEELANGPRQMYRQDLIDALPDTLQTAKYNRARPQLAEILDATGLGYSLPGKGKLPAVQTYGGVAVRGKGGVMNVADPFVPYAKIKKYEDTLKTGKVPLGGTQSTVIPTLAQVDPAHPLVNQLVHTGDSSALLGELPMDQAWLAARNQAGSLQTKLNSLGQPGILERILMGLGY